MSLCVKTTPSPMYLPSLPIPFPLPPSSPPPFPRLPFPFPPPSARLGRCTSGRPPPPLARVHLKPCPPLHLELADPRSPRGGRPKPCPLLTWAVHCRGAPGAAPPAAPPCQSAAAPYPYWPHPSCPPPLPSPSPPPPHLGGAPLGGGAPSSPCCPSRVNELLLPIHFNDKGHAEDEECGACDPRGLSRAPQKLRD